MNIKTLAATTSGSRIESYCLRIHLAALSLFFVWGTCCFGKTDAADDLGRLTQTGSVRLHDGTMAPFEVYGHGKRFILFGFPFYPLSKGYIENLAPDYRLIFSPYPGHMSMGEKKLYTLTASALVQDLLRMADAAGAKEFAYVGYSWGATVGLQLALRSDRVKALVVGGFPMIEGPYDQIRQTLRYSVDLGEKNPNWPDARQVLTYYESLIGFDERKVQDQLHLPRLNFLGSQDKVDFPGNVPVEFYSIFHRVESELQQNGWSTVTVPDQNHFTTSNPEVALPVLRPWLEKNWPANGH